MDTPFSYSTTYILDKAHYAECYSESVHTTPAISAYFKAALLFIAGWYILDAINLSPYAGAFILVLGIVEALSVKYQKAWWLARQMLSKAANGEVTLSIDDEAIRTKSVYVDSAILWSKVSTIEKTELGWLIEHTEGKNYISAQCLSDEAQAYIVKRRDDL